MAAALTDTTRRSSPRSLIHDDVGPSRARLEARTRAWATLLTGPGPPERWVPRLWRHPRPRKARGMLRRSGKACGRARGETGGTAGGFTERAQVTAEYVGMLLVVAAIVGALVAAGPAQRIADATVRAVCQIAGGDCGAAPTPSVDRAALDRAAADLAALRSHQPRPDYRRRVLQGPRPRRRRGARPRAAGARRQPRRRADPAALRGQRGGDPARGRAPRGGRRRRRRRAPAQAARARRPRPPLPAL